jgi:ribosomal-protein-alanine N-acetyltransferase
MHFRTLQADDDQRLLAFELANRDWFERFIPPRPGTMYTHDGIQAHIRDALAKYARGEFHPSLLLDEAGQVQGRANLIDINLEQRSCKLGYRIAEPHIGKGLATQAVEYLLALARKEWQLRQVWAFVTLENPASSRVLEKCGFVKGELVPGMSQLKHGVVDGVGYCLTLTA